MRKYHLEKINIKDIKYFTINVGLLPGYQENIEYTLKQAMALVKNFITKELEEGNKTLPFKITPSYFVYGFKKEEGYQINQESAIEIHGEILREYFPDIFDSNDLLLEKIQEFASCIGNGLEQKRIHLTFNNQKYILM